MQEAQPHMASKDPLVVLPGADVHKEPMGSGRLAASSPVEGAGFFTQLFATLQRQIIQKRRMWVSLLLEILLPVAFVLGLLGISQASSREKIPPRQYVDANGPVLFGTSMRDDFLCYKNDTAAHPDLQILLDPCPPITNGTSFCLQQSAHLPLEGLCLKPGSNTNFLPFARSVLTAETDVEVPNYDDYVLFKWVMCSLLPDSDDLFAESIATARQTGSIYISPRDGTSQAFANYMNETHVLFKHTFGGFFDSRDQAMPWLKEKQNEGKIWSFVEMLQADPSLISYTISMNRTAQEPTYSSTGVRNLYSVGLGSKPYARYVVSGAITIQKSINDYYLTHILGASPVDINPNATRSHLVVAPMPTDKYTDDEFLRIGGSMGPLLLVLAFLYPVSQLSKRLVEEKEQRLREGTMIMGLGKAAFFTSWLLVYYVQMFFISIVIAIIIKVGIATQSDFFIIWVAYLLFSITTVNLSALLSSFFSKAKIAALCVPLLYFLFSIPAFAIPDTSGSGVFYALSFLCPIPFSVALRLIFGYESNDGMGWNSVASTTDKPYNYGVCLAWFVIDFFLYIGLMLYFDNVLPKDWGTRLHPCYCCCICCQGKKAHDSDGVPMGVIEIDPNTCDNARNHMRPEFAKRCIQDYPRPNRDSSVHVSGLRKEFEGTNGTVNVAVDGMEVRMFPDSITVFLGHNGAGKTTVMNMMTGMLSPTAGDVTIYGNSILTNMQAIRRDIGFCPQHNILWDDLTCFEHLQYFARLKGMSGPEVDAEAIEMLTKVDLLDKRDVFSCNLSGGQKRKLSVAIAFMGKARLVLLDEPTAGMDVAARRHTWDVLKEMSSGRTILLTTHFMDEADLLGNRIAIMSKGSLHSYGTSTFLKNSLGAGYSMKIASLEHAANAEGYLAQIQTMMPAAFIREAKGQEVAIALPKDETRRFPDVIRMMESAEIKARLKIASVSMSATGLEEVFLSIAHKEDLGEATADAEANAHTHDTEEENVKIHFDSLEKVYLKLQAQQGGRVGGETGSTSVPIDGKQAQTRVKGAAGGSFGRQLKGMLLKRFNHGRRDGCAICLQVFAPIICIVIAMALGKLGPPTPDRLYYDNEMYGSVDQIMATSNCPNLVPYFDNSFVAKDSLSYPSVTDFSSYLLDTYRQHGKQERMVSFGCAVGNGGPIATSGDDNYMFVNATGLVTAPQSVQQFYRAKVRNATMNYDTSIVAAQWPLPFTERQQTQIDAISALLVALFVLIPFTFVPSTYVAYVVRERECKSKHLQFISGASYPAYWIGNFIFDFLSYLVVVAIAFIIFGIFDQEWAVGSVDAGFGTLVLFLLYGLSGIGFAYLVSFLFDNHSTAQTVIMMLNFLMGFLLVLLMFFLRQIESTKAGADVVVFFLRIIPPFALGDGLFLMVTSSALSSITGAKSSFHVDVAGWDMLFMGILSLVFLVATIVIDNPVVSRRIQMAAFGADKKATPVAFEDEDVARERKAVEEGKRPNDVVQVQGLRREFDLGGGRKKIAVQNITFGVKPGEVFGFLGTNGAGKTTTMSMLTTEIIPTCGSGRVGGYDIVQESDMTRRLIGYCPQFDAIMDLLTPAEHLSLFAALRGIAIEDTADVIEALINSCALQKYRDIPAGRLSGGNKRKLSVAMALIGGPSIVFLDEPSAGMDPHARRQMWDVIIFVAKHSSVVLTTHHLEEVDVLAHRVGIMDAGLMKCLGSLEHLKMKFGKGFELTLQVSETGLESATRFIATRYPTAVLVEARQQRILYTLPFDSTDLASLFEAIQRATDDPTIGIVDYTVQQTSLEQVFLRISEPNDEANANERNLLQLVDNPALPGVALGDRESIADPEEMTSRNVIRRSSYSSAAFDNHAAAANTNGITNNRHPSAIIDEETVPYDDI